MQLDEETGEWYIENLEEFLNVTKVDSNQKEAKQMLAMGFNYDEECKKC